MKSFISVLTLLIVLFLMIGCASQIKYERIPFTPPPKSEAYKIPVDPFTEVVAPEIIFIKKDVDGGYKICEKEQADLFAFTVKDLNKITLRIQYYKDLTHQLETLVNLRIQRENFLIDLIIDQNLLKELLREFNVDLQNKISSDKFWGSLEKGGYWGVILGLIIEAAILAAH